MPADLDKVTASALLLTLEDRAALAQRLLTTLDEAEGADVESLWIAEAERRSGEIDRGDAKLVNVDDAFRALHAVIENCRQGFTRQ